MQVSGPGNGTVNGQICWTVTGAPGMPGVRFPSGGQVTDVTIKPSSRSGAWVICFTPKAKGLLTVSIGAGAERASCDILIH